MIAEGIRMKIALVFLLLMGLIVLGLPFSIQGDGSLTGAVQSFMSYGFAATGVLLGMLTIFLSRSLSDELTNRQIFLVMTKPVSRAQYIAGKWLGMVLLNTIFLVGAGMTMYAMVHYIKATHPPIDERYDANQLENEVLVARHAVKPKLPSFSFLADAEFERNLEDGTYDNRPDFDPRDEKARLMKKHEASWRVVGPQDARQFDFENVLVDRSRATHVYLRYKAEVSNYPPDEIFRSQWLIGDRHKGTAEYNIQVRHVVGRYHTFPVPVDAVAPDNTLTVRFFNRNPYPGEPQFRNVIEFRKADEIEVLFVVGSFEGNMLRLLTLIWCKLVFLAAVAILMTTMFSFPVAALASFTVYVLAGAKSFIMEALEFAVPSYESMFTSFKSFAVHTIEMMYEGILYVLPDFTRYNAIEELVNGRNVGLVWVLQGFVELGLLKTGIVLGLAILLYKRRELAETSF
jgi:hypothetical protein